MDIREAMERIYNYSKYIENLPKAKTLDIKYSKYYEDCFCLVVECPYCHKKHNHAMKKNDKFEVRGADCFRGEYVISP